MKMTSVAQCIQCRDRRSLADVFSAAVHHCSIASSTLYIALGISIHLFFTFKPKQTLE